MDRTATRFALWVLLGSLLLQAAWLLALPPFRGIDEFDHAYRAASVADGQWLPSGQTTALGRGELVTVPAAIVEDAGPVCSQLRYTGQHNCNPAETLDDGRVTVATAASRYNPVFYWIVGTASRPLDGAGALYVMRVANALLVSLALAVAAWVTARSSTTIWPRVGFLGALTPTTVYSGAVAAPNALEAVAALGVWSCLLGLKRVQSGLQGHLLVLAGAFAVPLSLLRGLGPLWLALIVLVCALNLGPSRVVVLARTHRRAFWWGVGLSVGSTVAGTAWTLAVGALGLEEVVDVSADGEDIPAAGNPWSATARSIPLWLLQVVAAFPLRNQPAPSAVYACGLLAIGGLLVAGLARATGRDRAVLAAALVLAVGVPFALQGYVYPAAGGIWQGRYGWPVGMGVLMLAAAALQQRPPQHSLLGPALFSAATLWITAHAVSTTSLLLGENASSPLAGDDRWMTAPPPLVAGLAVAGVLAWSTGAMPSRMRCTGPRPSPWGSPSAVLDNEIPGSRPG